MAKVKYLMSKSLSVFMLFCMLFPIVACSNDILGTKVPQSISMKQAGPSSPDIRNASLKFSEVEGKVFTLESVVTLKDGSTSTNVKWSYPDKGISVTDETNGALTFMITDVGTYTFTATAVYNGSLTGTKTSCTVNILGALTGLGIRTEGSTSISDTIYITMNDKNSKEVRLIPDFMPKDTIVASQKGVQWESFSNEHFNLTQEEYRIKDTPNQNETLNTAVITPISPGSGKVIVRSTKNTSIYKEINVVIRAAATEQDTPATEVTFDKTSLTHELGPENRKTLTATVINGFKDVVTTGAVKFESSDESVVKIVHSTDRQVTIEGLKSGKADITATYKREDGTEAKTTCNVTTSGGIDIIGTDTSYYKFPVSTKNNDVITGPNDIKVFYNPTDTTQKGFFINVANNAVASTIAAEEHDDYVVLKMVGEGTTDVTITSKYDQTKEHTFTIEVFKELTSKDKINKLVVDKSSIKFEPPFAQSYEILSATTKIYSDNTLEDIQDGNYETYKIKWESENPEVATVQDNNNGTATVRPVAPGETRIIATSVVDGNELKYSVATNVLVTGKLENFIPERNSVQVTAGGQTDLIVHPYPENAILKEEKIRYVVGDEATANVQMELNKVSNLIKFTITGKLPGKTDVALIVEGKEMCRIPVFVNAKNDRYLTALNFDTPSSIMRQDAKSVTHKLTAYDQNNKEMEVTSDNVVLELIENGKVYDYDSINKSRHVEIHTDGNGNFTFSPKEPGVTILKASAKQIADGVENRPSATLRIEVGGAALHEGLKELRPAVNKVQIKKNSSMEIETRFIPYSYEEGHDLSMDWSIANDDEENVRIMGENGNVLKISGQTIGTDILHGENPESNRTTQFTVEVVEKDAYAVKLDKYYLSFDRNQKDPPIVRAIVTKDGVEVRGETVRWKFDKEGNDFISKNDNGNTTSVYMSNNEHATGEAYLTAEFVHNDVVVASASCLVEVVDSSAKPTLRNIVPQYESVIMNENIQTLDIGYEIVPASFKDDVNLDFTYSQNGIVHAVHNKDRGVIEVTSLNPGTVTLTAAVKESERKISCDIKITVEKAKEKSELTNISINKPTLVLSMKDTTGEYLDVVGYDQFGNRTTTDGKIGYSIIESGEVKAVDEDLEFVSVTVNDQGLYVAPKNAGLAIIRVYLLDDASKYAECRVEVGGAATVEGLQSLLPNSNHIQLRVGDSVKTSISFIPSTYENQNIKWTVKPLNDGDDKATSFSYNNGKTKDITIKGVKVGTDTYTAESNYIDPISQKAISTSFIVEVVDTDAYTIKLDKNYLSFDLAQKAPPVIKATVYKNGKEDTTKKVVWTTTATDAYVDAVSDSRNTITITLRKDAAVGTGRLTAAIEGMTNISASCVIEVVDSTDNTKLRALALESSSIELVNGEGAKSLGYSVLPANMKDNVDFEFTYSRSGIVKASHDTTGKKITLTPEKVGATKVTVTAINKTDGSRAVAELSVVVSSPATISKLTNIKFNNETLVMNPDSDGENLIVTGVDQNGRTIVVKDTDVTFEVIENGETKPVDGTHEYVSVKVLASGDGVFVKPGQNSGVAYIRASLTVNRAMYAECRVEVGGAAIVEGLQSLIPSHNHLQIKRNSSANAFVTFIPSTYENQNVNWEIEKKATPNATTFDFVNGKTKNILIHGKNLGTDTYIATSQKDATKSTRIIVDVVDTDAYSIVLDKNYLSFDLAQKAPPVITATVYKNGAIDRTKEVEWVTDEVANFVNTSSNSNNSLSIILKQDATVGSGKITASIKDMKDISASCVIEVVDSTNNTKLRALALESSSIELVNGEGAKSLGYSILPANMKGNVKLEFTYSRSGVVKASQTADNGGEITLTPVYPGTTKITIVAKDKDEQNTSSASATLNVTVLNKLADSEIARLSFDKPSISMKQDSNGEKLILSAVDQYGQKISAKDKFGLEIIENGEVKALGDEFEYVDVKMVQTESGDELFITPKNSGVAYIKAYLEANPSINTECIVEVGGAATKSEITELVPSANYLQVQKGKSVDATINFIPSTFEDKRVDWDYKTGNADDTTKVVTHYEYKDANKASIRIYGDDYGTDVYTAKAKANNDKTATFKVEVVDDAYRINLDRSYISYDLAQKAAPVITATVYKNDVIDNTAQVIWNFDEIADFADCQTIGNGNSVTISLKSDAKESSGKLVAKLALNENISSSCFVEVVDSTNQTALRSLSLESSYISMYRDDIEHISYNILPQSQADNVEFSFNYTNPNIAAVKADTERRELSITALAVGYTNVTITAKNKEDGTVASTKIAISVKKSDANPNFLELDQSYMEVSQRDMDKTFYVNAKLTDYLGKRVTGVDTRINWEVSEGGERIISYKGEGSRFAFSPLSAGEVMVTASYPGINSQSILITVGTADAVYNKATEHLLPSSDKIVMKAGDETSVWVTLAPNGNAEKVDFKWSSADSSIAKVSSSSANPSVALVEIPEGVADGSTTQIKVEDAGKSAEIKIVVKSDTTDMTTSLMVNPQVVVLDLDAKDLTRFKVRMFESGEEVDPNNKIDVDTSEIANYVELLNTTTSGMLDIREKAVGSGIVTFSDVNDPEMTVRAYVDVVKSSTLPKILKNVTLTPSTKTLLIGEAAEIKANAIPMSVANEASVKYEFSSGNNNVVRVEHTTGETAKIVGVGVGTTEVTTTVTYNGEKKSASMIVTVPSNAPRISHVELDANSVALDQMDADRWTTVNAVVMSTNGKTSFPVTWIVPENADNYIEVEIEGNALSMRPVSAGKLEIKAEYEGRIATLLVTIGEEKSVYGDIIGLEPSVNGTVELLRDGSFQIWVTPIGGSVIPEIEWNADGNVTVSQNKFNKNYATVTAGKVDGTGSVTATIIDGKQNDKTATFNFNVTQNGTGTVSAVTVKPSKLVIDLDSKALPQFTATSYVDGEAVDTYEFEWMIDNDSAVLDGFANVEGRGKQNATGILTLDVENAEVTTGYVKTFTKNAQDAYARAIVEVVKSSEIKVGLQDIMVNVPENLTMTEGQSIEVKFTSVPNAYTADTEFSMTSSDPDSVLVYGNRIIALKKVAQPVTVKVEGVHELAKKEITINVTVVEKPAVANNIVIEADGKTNGIIEIANGAKKEVTATLYDTNGNEMLNTTLVWIFENNDVVGKEITEKGHKAILTAKKNDSYVKFKVSSGSIATEGYVVVGTPANQLEGLIANPSMITVAVNEKYPFEIYAVPNSVADKVSYEYRTDNNNIAKITENDKQYIKGLAEGKSKLIVEGTDGVKKASTTINVNVNGTLQPSRIDIDRSKVVLSNNINKVEVSAQILSKEGKIFDGDVTWLIEDENVATLEKVEGEPNKIMVVAKGTGETLLKASYQGLMSSVPVTYSLVETTTKIPTGLYALSSQIILDNPNTIIEAGDPDLMTAANAEVGFTPNNLEEDCKTVAWSISGTSIAVDETQHGYMPGDKTTRNGKLAIKAVKAGTSIITATSVVDPSKQVEIKVIVLDENVRVEGGIPSLELDKTRIVIEANGVDSAEVKATLKDSDGAEMHDGYKDLKWSLNPENIVTMEEVDQSTRSFKAKELKAGKTYLKVSYPITLSDGSTGPEIDRSIAIETIVKADVGKKLTAILLDRTEFVMISGNTEQLNYEVNPRINDVTITWVSNNESVADVSNDGVVTAKNTGTANIEVTATQTVEGDVIQVTDSVKVTVINGVPKSSKYSAINVDNNVLDLIKNGSSAHLTYEILNADGTTNTADQISKIEVYGINGKKIATYTPENWKDGTATMENDYFKLETVGKAPRNFTIYPKKSGTFSIQAWVFDDIADESQGGVGITTLLNIAGDVKGVGISTNFLHMAIGDTEDVSVSFNPSSSIIEGGTAEWSVTAKDGDTDFISIENRTKNSATIRAKKYGTGSLVYKYIENNETKTATVEISVEDRSALSGGVKKIAFSSRFEEIEYPYPRSKHYDATVSFFDGSSTKEDIRYYLSDKDGNELQGADLANAQKIARLSYSLATGVDVIPQKAGTIYITAECMPIGAKDAYTATMQITIKGAINALIPSHSKLVLYTGGSTEVSVTPDDKNAPGASYTWTVVEEKKLDLTNGTVSDLNHYSRALEEFIIMDTTNASSVIIGAKDIITDSSDSEYNKALFDSYPRRVTIEVKATQYENVKTQIVVDVLPLAVENYYPKKLEISVPTNNIDVPESGSFTHNDRVTATAAVYDRNGNAIDATIDWYFYPIGNDGNSAWWTEIEDGKPSYQKKSWINPNNHISNPYIDAYLNEESDEISFIPTQSGQYRLKAIVRENPYLQKSQNIYVGGAVTDLNATLNDSVVNNIDIIKGNIVELGTSFTPSNALAGDPIWILYSQKHIKNTDKDVDESTVNLCANDYFNIIQNGRNVSVRGIEVTDGNTAIKPNDLMLLVEYYDDATIRQEFKEILAENGMITLKQYNDVLKDKNTAGKVHSKTVRVNILPKDMTVVTFSIADLPQSIDPSKVESAIPFTVTATATGANAGMVFNNWDWLDVEIVGADSQLIYATTRTREVTEGGQKKKVAAWNSVDNKTENGQYLKYPIAENGLINRNGNGYSFILYPNGVPTEPVNVRVSLNEAYKDGIDEDGNKVFDIDTIKFNPYNRLCYIGGKVTSITATTTTYNLNNSVQSSEGSNVDMIMGANAVLTITYNPTYTHQKGVIWYAPHNPKYTNFQSLAGKDKSQCTVFGRNATVVNNQVSSEILRAVSIYDPWFDKMAAAYAASSPNRTEEEWRSKYYSMSNIDHLKDENAEWFRYPREDELSPGLFYDYQITVQSLADQIKFLSISQAKNGKVDPDTGIVTTRPGYYTLTDSAKYPPVESTGEVYCYDSTGASGALDENNDGLADNNGGVAAYLIETTLTPNYGYNLKFQIEDGAEIGYLDNYEIDGGSNQFRFVPNGARFTNTNDVFINYGDVTISATNPELNISKKFVLHYLPSNIKLVKYIGENDDGTVPKEWKNGVVLTSDVQGGPQYINMDESGEWDINDSETNPGMFELNPLEKILLYPGETFDLSAVAFFNNEPQYVANGVDLNQGNDDKNNPNLSHDEKKYAISYTVLASDSGSKVPVENYLEFVYESDDTKTRLPLDNEAGKLDRPAVKEGDVWVDKDGQSDWFRTAKSTIKAPNNGMQGAIYLAYTIAPIKPGKLDPVNPSKPVEDTIDVSQRINGGIWVYISEPVDQVLAYSVSQSYENDKATSNPVAVQLDGKVSLAQLGNPIINGVERPDYPSHWFMGEYGFCASGDINKGTTQFYGTSFLSFEPKNNEEISLVKINSDYSNAVAVPMSYVTDYKTADKALIISAKNLPEQNKILDTFWGEPTFEHMDLFGEFGIAKFPNVTSINIIEDGTMNSFIGSYIQTGSTTLDFTKPAMVGANQLEFYRHSGMGDLGRSINIIVPPKNVKELRLSGNKLNCMFDFSKGSGNTIEILDLSDNRFTGLSIRNLKNLKVVNLSGPNSLIYTNNNQDDFTSSSDKTTANRFLNITGCPKLRVVNLDNTRFNHAAIEFEKSTEFRNPEYDAVLSARVEVGNNDSSDTAFLRTLAISGSVGIVDITGQKNMQSFIHTAALKNELTDVNTTSVNENQFQYTKGSEEYTWIQQLITGKPEGSNASLKDNFQTPQPDREEQIIPGYTNPDTKFKNRYGENDYSLVWSAWEGAVQNSDYPNNTTTREAIYDRQMLASERDNSKTSDHYYIVPMHDSKSDDIAETERWNPSGKVKLVKLGMLMERDRWREQQVMKKIGEFSLEFADKFCESILLQNNKYDYLSFDIAFENISSSMSEINIGEIGNDVRVSFKFNTEGYAGGSLKSVNVGALYGELSLAGNIIERTQFNNSKSFIDQFGSYGAAGSVNLAGSSITDLNAIKGNIKSLNIDNVYNITEFRLENGNGGQFSTLEHLSANNSSIESIFIARDSKLKTLSASKLKNGLTGTLTAAGEKGGDLAFVIEGKNLEKIELNKAGLYKKHWKLGNFTYRSSRPRVVMNDYIGPGEAAKDGGFPYGYSMNEKRYSKVKFSDVRYETSTYYDPEEDEDVTVSEWRYTMKTETDPNSTITKDIDWKTWGLDKLTELSMYGNSIIFRWETAAGAMKMGEAVDRGLITGPVEVEPRKTVHPAYKPNEAYTTLKEKIDSKKYLWWEKAEWDELESAIQANGYLRTIDGVQCFVGTRNTILKKYFEVETSFTVVEDISGFDWRTVTYSVADRQDGHENDRFSLRYGTGLENALNDVDMIGFGVHVLGFKKYKDNGFLAKPSRGYVSFVDFPNNSESYRAEGGNLADISVGAQDEAPTGRQSAILVNKGNKICITRDTNEVFIKDSKGKIVSPSGIKAQYKFYDQNTQFYAHDAVAVIYPFGS